MGLIWRKSLPEAMSTGDRTEYIKVHREEKRKTVLGFNDLSACIHQQDFNHLVNNYNTFYLWVPLKKAKVTLQSIKTNSKRIENN